MELPSLYTTRYLFESDALFFEKDSNLLPFSGHIHRWTSPVLLQALEHGIIRATAQHVRIQKSPRGRLGRAQVWAPGWDGVQVREESDD